MGDRRRSSGDGVSPKEEFLLLPPAVDNVEDSIKFFDCCLVASTSVILHSRQLLPAERFRKMYVHGLLSQILKPDDKVAARIINKLRGVSSALKKGFLKEYIIVVSDDRDDPNSVTELYSWEFSYLSSGTPTANFVDGNGNRIVSVSYRGRDHIRNQLKVLLVKLVNLCRHVLLPVGGNCYPGLRVTYTESRPEKYHVPGFEPSQILYRLGKEVRPVPFLDNGMASKRHSAFVIVSSSFLPPHEEAVIVAQINGKASKSSFSDFDNVPQAVEKGDQAPKKDDSFHFLTSDNSDEDDGLEATRLDAKSSDVDPMATNNLQLTKDLEKGHAVDSSSAEIYRNTATSVTTVGANDDPFEESSLMGSRRTRSSATTVSMFSSEVSAIQAKGGKKSENPPVKRIRSKRSRKRVESDDDEEDEQIQKPPSKAPRRRTRKP